MPIEHLVVLMMENRSFDHMLGFMKSELGVDGLDGTETNPAPDGTLVHVSQDALPVGDLPDPGHHFEDVSQQVFGTRSPVPGAAPTMQGFVQAYAEHERSLSTGKRIMKCFSPASIPVLSTLAREFAVCDHWFSSVPGPTSPNRMFAHAATSLGEIFPDPLWLDLKTIYELLDRNRVSYRIYTSSDVTFLQGVWYLMRHQHGFADYNTFVQDCGAGDLPAYTWIEPRFSKDGGFQENDEHPNWDVRDGEDLIREVYEAIRNNASLWQNTLLLITFDEHGGIYDHCAPPDIPPSGPASVNPSFAFDRLGVRVPAILVSPFIDSCVDSRQYEHSSIVATVRKLFCPNSPALTQRDARANTFERILNRTTARSDRIVFPSNGKSATRAGGGNHADHPASDLAITIVRHMARTLQAIGVSPPPLPNAPISSQEATNYMRKAVALVRSTDSGKWRPD